MQRSTSSMSHDRLEGSDSGGSLGDHDGYTDDGKGEARHHQPIFHHDINEQGAELDEFGRRRTTQGPNYAFWAKAVERTNKDIVPVNTKKNRFPHAIVWSPLPPITWLIPFIGHMGITNSEGVIFDFAGPYTISRDDMAFGSPTRYLTLSPTAAQKADWDTAVGQGCAIYEQRMHNIWYVLTSSGLRHDDGGTCGYSCDNCHSHVARCLNHMKYNGYQRWNMIILCFWIFICGRYTDVGGFLKSWLPSLIILGIILVALYAR